MCDKNKQFNIQNWLLFYCSEVHSLNIIPLIMCVITTLRSTFYVIHADWIFLLGYRNSHYTTASIPRSPTTYQHCHFLHHKNTQSPHRLWLLGTYPKVKWWLTVCVCVCISVSYLSYAWYKNLIFYPCWFTSSHNNGQRVQITQLFTTWFL